MVTRLKKEYSFEEKDEWRFWVTPKLLREKAIHRWCVFPHSFTNELVHSLIDEWKISQDDRILDPFCGAGTTVLAAKEKGVSATGYDISPYASFVSNVKVENYDKEVLEEIWCLWREKIKPEGWSSVLRQYPSFLHKALPGRLLGAFDCLQTQITTLPGSESEKNFFRLALLSIIPVFSRAQASGGWLKWTDKKNNVRSIERCLSMQVDQMLADVHDYSSFHNNSRTCNYRSMVADARSLPDKGPTYSAVITSPPYPNRHDYTRVFGVELLFGFLDWDQTRQLRYQSFHSHPESHPSRPDCEKYIQPKTLSDIIEKMKRNNAESRIVRMLEGYFLDMFLCLSEIKRVCKADANIAMVLGNAQYYGCPIPVDLLTAKIAETVGLKVERIVVARYRGNSAQQMKMYGRHRSRESIVMLKK